MELDRGAIVLGGVVIFTRSVEGRWEREVRALELLRRKSVESVLRFGDGTAFVTGGDGGSVRLDLPAPRLTVRVRVHDETSPVSRRESCRDLRSPTGVRIRPLAGPTIWTVPEQGGGYDVLVPVECVPARPAGPRR